MQGKRLPIALVLVGVLVFAGIAGAAFKPFKSYPAGGETLAVTTGDFNGDGHTDVVATSRASDTFTLLRGNGNGKFKAPQDFPAGDAPLGVAKADFNHDGRLDLAIGHQVGGGVSIVLGKRHGFRHPVSYRTDSQSAYVVVADLGKGKQRDLAVAGQGANTISVLHGRPHGKFSAPQMITGVNDPFAITAGRLSGDHYTDLICTTDDGISVFRGKKDGKFHDEKTYAAGDGPNDVIIGRVDGDRKSDVVVADYSHGSVFVLRGEGHGKLAEAKSYPAASNSAAGVRFIDYDHNKRRDLAVTDDNNADSDVAILRGTRHGFKAPKLFPVADGPYGLAVGRFNEDKSPDIAATSYNPGAVSILLSK
jgi:hypothetical protein